MPSYNHKVHADGQVTSDVPGYTVTYPATCNGRLRDLGFVASRGYGGSNFVHFDTAGEPYGTPLTVAARERLRALRRGFPYTPPLTAVRVHQREAKRHFENGGRVLVSEYGHEDTRLVTPSTTTHTRETTTWDDLVAQVDMWRGRYPYQRFYVIGDTDA